MEQMEMSDQKAKNAQNIISFIFFTLEFFSASSILFDKN